jgi:hypothetical protein
MKFQIVASLQMVGRRTISRLSGTPPSFVANNVTATQSVSGSTIGSNGQ